MDQKSSNIINSFRVKRVSLARETSKNFNPSLARRAFRGSRRVYRAKSMKVVICANIFSGNLRVACAEILIDYDQVNFEMFSSLSDAAFAISQLWHSRVSKFDAALD